MMDGGRRHKGGNYNHEFTRTRSQNRKPPLGNWQPTVPSWEKKFCKFVGLVSWQKFLDTKKFIHLYENVLKWNDSAGEEAFHNAKNRFWAKINGLPCDISIPDPDIYIDDIDWNSKVDPELLLDLEQDSVVPDGDENDEKVVILGNPLLSDQSFSCTGWGDTEEGFKKAGNSSSDNNENPAGIYDSQGDGAMRENENKGYGAMEDSGWGDVCNNSWNENKGNGSMEESGLEDNWNNSSGWNQWENNNYGSDILNKNSVDEGWGKWEMSNANRESATRYMSRYKTSRFHSNDNYMNREWRNGKERKRVNFAYERPFTDKRFTPKQF